MNLHQLTATELRDSFLKGKSKPLPSQNTFSSESKNMTKSWGLF